MKRTYLFRFAASTIKWGTPFKYTIEFGTRPVEFLLQGAQYVIVFERFKECKLQVSIDLLLVTVEMDIPGDFQYIRSAVTLGSSVFSAYWKHPSMESLEQKPV